MGSYNVLYFKAHNSRTDGRIRIADHFLKVHKSDVFWDPLIFTNFLFVLEKSGEQNKAIFDTIWPWKMMRVSAEYDPQIADIIENLYNNIIVYQSPGDKMV